MYEQHVGRGISKAGAQINFSQETMPQKAGQKCFLQIAGASMLSAPLCRIPCALSGEPSVC